MYMPHTVTIYNITRHTDVDTLKETVTNYITILRGVFLDASKAVNVRTSGLEGADAVNLYIPFSVHAIDGVSLFERQYISAKEFEAADNKSKFWTLKTGNDCFFIKGEVAEPDLDFQEIKQKYDDVYIVTKVDRKDFGTPDMQHWEVGGN